MKLPRLRWLTLTALLGLAVFVVLVVLAFELPRSTPFTAALDTTALDFTTGPDPTLDPDSGEIGLLSGHGILDLRVAGCTSLQLVSLGDPQSQPCDEDALEIKRAQLSRVQIDEGTRVSLWLTRDAVHMKLDPPVHSGGVKIFVTADPGDARGKAGNGTQFGENMNVPPGEWRVVPTARIVTLDLRDSSGEPLTVAEEDVKLGRGSSVFFETERKTSALVGTANTLQLPELPKDMDTVRLPRGIVTVRKLQSGNIRHLGVTRRDGRLQSLHVELTGRSDALYVPDIYSDKPQNQALTLFDANSGRDRKLRMIAIVVLVFGTVTALNSLFALFRHFAELWLALPHPRASLSQRRLLRTVRRWLEPAASAIEDEAAEEQEDEGNAASNGVPGVDDV